METIRCINRHAGKRDQPLSEWLLGQPRQILVQCLPLYVLSWLLPVNGAGKIFTATALWFFPNLIPVAPCRSELIVRKSCLRICSMEEKNVIRWFQVSHPSWPQSGGWTSTKTFQSLKCCFITCGMCSITQRSWIFWSASSAVSPRSGSKKV